jgi:hypothetical protein
MDNDVIDLIEKRKIPVFVIEEDLAVRGIEGSELVPGIQPGRRPASEAVPTKKAPLE